MYPGYFKVSFLINEDCLGHLCKVSSDFVRICKLSKIQADKGVVKCNNHRSTLGTFPQCVISYSNLVLSSTGSDSVMCAKFQIILMRYGEFSSKGGVGIIFHIYSIAEPNCQAGFAINKLREATSYYQNILLFISKPGSVAFGSPKNKK